ncbi:uncharacterized protein LOC113340850 [Papaver somniferum]|uniref:uncharacterized protein LOC113340850 n=1 Tax=Papaver somniferum TaxID=3469 RepID=UPI000E6F6DAF|nr:uncharacterized protein LOC113340850 [Papaver somniferum]
MTHFKALYGYNPPHMAFPTSVVTYVTACESYMKERDAMLDVLKETLFKSQERMKFFDENNRVDRVFEVQDRFYLKLQPCRQDSVALHKNLKIYVKYYGPFTILQKIGLLAYKLELTTSARIHTVFHVSQLKKQIVQAHLLSPALPIVDHEGQIIMQHESISESREVVRKVIQLLIQWTNSSPEDATWEDMTNISSQNPKFMATYSFSLILKDEDNFQW